MPAWWEIAEFLLAVHDPSGHQVLGLATWVSARAAKDGTMGDLSPYWGEQRGDFAWVLTSQHDHGANLVRTLSKAGILHGC